MDDNFIYTGNNLGYLVP